jgi:hypothetical protein
MRAAMVKLRLLSFSSISFECCIHIIHRCKNLAYLFFFVLQTGALLAAPGNNVVIVKNGKSQVVISKSSNPGVVQNFAANELAKYLKQISGAEVPVKPYNFGTTSSIRLELKAGQDRDGYSIAIVDNNIILSGNSDAAILFAVYDFLSRLGCIWLAPDFLIYEHKAEVVPHKTTLVYSSNYAIREKPVFAYRKLDVDGGRTHTAENLKQIIAWMPKLRYNTLRVPVNLNGNGRIQWDKWRNELTPELKKRGIMLEVGGHGYQNFLNATMENGKLFTDHPEWFAKDSSCKPTPSDRLVFNTSNSEAVQYFIRNVTDYIQQHPEINIFGLWPPDVGRWADCKEFEDYGKPSDRQAAFSNVVAEAIHRVRPDIITEIIAYSYTLLPPRKTKLNKYIQVDFCPINQSFEKQIFDVTSQNNREYVNALKNWRQSFPGDIGLYSYYRKYAWRSAPNVIPHYIKNDMQWYASLQLQGISTYAEPGDWFTYELNHMILGYMAWDPSLDVNLLCDKYYKARYGTHWLIAKKAYESLEKISPLYGSVPFTILKSEPEIKTARFQIETHINEIKNAQDSSRNLAAAKNFSRLSLMLQYLQKDLQIQEKRAEGSNAEVILQHIKELLALMQANLDKGVFILTGQNDLARFTKKYGLTNQSLLD